MKNIAIQMDANCFNDTENCEDLFVSFTYIRLYLLRFRYNVRFLAFEEIKNRKI